jgi:phenylacetic acid degradation operon negative regulatory protein
MLPHGWVGHEAYDLVKRVYKVLVNCSMDYIQQDLENAQGPLPKAHSLFFTRFGGLD